MKKMQRFAWIIVEIPYVLLYILCIPFIIIFLPIIAAHSTWMTIVRYAETGVWKWDFWEL